LDLVLDIDPRKGSEEGYSMLVRDSKCDFSGYPTVKTGGGGLHIYMRLDEVVKLRNELDVYPGVEFKSAGRQVVASGGTHPETGEMYEWLTKVPKVPLAPGGFISFLLSMQPKLPDNQEIPDMAQMSPDRLGEVLSKLPVEDYRTNDSWFALMAASYHATCGAGEDEFVLWSIGDPEYAGQEDQIRSRWRSLSNPGCGVRTAGTLIRELRLRGHDVPVELDGPDLSDYVATVKDAAKRAEELSANSSADEIRSVMSSMSQFDPLDQEDLIDTVHKLTGKPKAALRKAASGGKGGKNGIDIPEKVAEMVLEREFSSGRTITFSRDRQYWRYNGTFWEPYCTDQLKGKLKDYAIGLRDIYPKAEFHLAQTIMSSEVVLRATVANGLDLLGVTKAPSPVVNCANTELWLSEGGFESKPHSPDSHLTYCLPIRYDPLATCPIFDDTLDGIFGLQEDKDGIVRHMWEVLGYTIYPRKWIPAWFLFHGRGANGKSVILDTLMSLLGPTARPVAAISDLSSKRNDYATSECVGALAVIDDDVEKGAVLNDGILKKLSEDKLIRGRLLHKDWFTFRNCAVVFMATNHWPKVRDLSNGMVRRAYGFPFRRQFKQDGSRKKTILDNELPGVLNGALRGLMRLQERGRFDVPPSCKALIDTWLVHSNQILGYLADCHNSGVWDGTKSLSVLWEGYDQWSAKNGYKRAYSKPGFREALLAYGLTEASNGELGGKK